MKTYIVPKGVPAVAYSKTNFTHKDTEQRTAFTDKDIIYPGATQGFGAEWPFLPGQMRFKLPGGMSIIPDSISKEYHPVRYMDIRLEVIKVVDQ